MRAALGLAGLLLLPLAGAQGMAGDDWDGVLVLAADGEVFEYAWHGVGCSTPDHCWFRYDAFYRVEAGGLVPVSGSAAWEYPSVGELAAVFLVHLTLDAAPRDVVWVAVVHSICSGMYDGAVYGSSGLALGPAEALKTGPGPDGWYECMPS
jgi:hypothetical protein